MRGISGAVQASVSFAGGCASALCPAFGCPAFGPPPHKLSQPLGRHCCGRARCLALDGVLLAFLSGVLLPWKSGHVAIIRVLFKKKKIASR